MMRVFRANSIARLEPSAEYTRNLIDFQLPATKEFYSIHSEAYRYRRQHGLPLDATSWSQAVLAWGLNITRKDLYRIQYLIMPLWWETVEGMPDQRLIDTVMVDADREQRCNGVYEQIEHLLRLCSSQFPGHVVPRYWHLCALDALVVRCHEAAQAARRKGLWDANGCITARGLELWREVASTTQTIGADAQATHEAPEAEDNVATLEATKHEATGFDHPDLGELNV